jgi:HK97 family phage portal protein
MPALKQAARNVFTIVRQTTPAFSGVNGQIPHYGGAGTKSGQKVDEASSLRVAAIWIACTFLADEAASLTMKIVKRDDVSRVPQRPPALRALWGKPNTDQTHVGFDVSEVLSMSLWGASYTALGWTRAKELAVRWPLDPDGVTRERAEHGGLVLKSRGQGELHNRPDERPEFSCVPLYELPGKLTPVSPVRMAAELAGLSLAYEEVSARLAGKGMNPSVVVTADAVVNDEQSKQLSSRLEQTYGGSSNAGKFAVLGGKGMKLERLAMSAVDAQMIEHENKIFNTLMAMWRVPPTVAGMVDKASSWGTGIAEFSLGVQRFTLRPIVERRQAAQEEIAAVVDPDLQVRHKFDALLSAAPKDRAEIHARRLQTGSTSVERVLAQEDEPPFGEEETVYSPLAMATEEDRKLSQLAIKADAYAALIRAGVEPPAAAEETGFDPATFKHTGALPTTLQGDD